MKPEFSYRRALRFAETDMAGVGHFAAILTLVEEAWHAWLGSLGECVHPAACPAGAEPVGWPVVSLNVEFLRPVHFAEHLEVRLAVTRLGRSSVTLEFTIIGTAGNCARGTFITVCSAPAADGQWQAHPLPASLVAKFTPA